MKEKLLKKFAELFGEGGDILSYFSPGRVNLIGGHTDYNGGHVFPCTLTLGTYAVVRKRRDQKLRFFSQNMEQIGILESDLSDLIFNPADGFGNYLKGVIWSFIQKGYSIPYGMDLMVAGDIPSGAGLSSSASLEMVMCLILKEMYDFSDLSLSDLALIAQSAENMYCHIHCGIMDPFTIAMGKKGHALFLDTSNLSYEYIPLHLEHEKLIIAYSNKKRCIANSKYNERRRECETALYDLQKLTTISSLSELTMDAFEMVKSAISDPICVKRARHAVSENQRTIQAARALKENDLILFGKLMNQSHISLRDDYEVTGKELDTLVQAAWEHQGVLGARMRGAGFGGCTVNLVKNESVDSFIEQVGEKYQNTIGYPADFYVVKTGSGVCRC